MHNVQRIMLVLSVAAFCTTAHAQLSTVGSGWQVENIGVGIKPSFDFGPDNEIHVMGITEELFGGVAWHATADSIDGPWVPTVVSTGYFYGPGDLQVDQTTGTAHLAYHDHDAQDAVHFAIDEDGAQKSVQITPDTHDGWDNSLAIDSSGDVRMASIFPTQFGAVSSLVVGSQNEGGDWDSELLLASGGGMYGLNTSIDIDADDQSHVLFNLAADWTGPGSVRYASELDDGAWSVETIESGNNVGRFPTLAIDANDQLHAAWINLRDDPQFADVRYGTLVDDEWQIETIAELDNVDMGFFGARKLVGLDIDSKGNPHLAIGDQNEVSYLTREADGPWQESAVVETDGDLLNGLVVLRLDSDDNPGIAFWQPVGVQGLGIVSLAIGSSPSVDLLGDFDGDGELTVNDIDLLSANFRTDDPAFDLNGDGGVGLGDYSLWVDDLATVLRGDANLDGIVDFADFLALTGNFDNRNGGWAEGNFDGQGGVGFPDFLLLADNFGQTAAGATASVPEPSASHTVWLVSVAAFVCLRGGARRNAAPNTK